MKKTGIPESFISGKKAELDRFFFQPVYKTDEIPRAEDFKFLKGYQGFFNFNPSTGGRDKDGTKRIVMLMRDFRRERLKELAKSRDPKKEKKYKRLLKEYELKYKNNPSQEQISLYGDLMSMIEGILQSYKIKVKNEVVSEIANCDFPSPLKIKRTKKFIKAKVDESIDVVKDGEVHFSINMLIGTVRGMARLFDEYLDKTMLVPGVVSRRYGKKIKKDKRKMLDIFQLVFFRRLLGNYSSMPSGWFVVKIEDYDTRAIISAVDRDMIPLITADNDGSSDVFNSDVFPEMFLFVYWSFMKHKTIEPLIESIDWCFNTTKDLNEKNIRDFVKKERENVE